MVVVKNGYYLDTVTGVCKKLSSIEDLRGTIDDIPDDVILKLNTKDFTVLVDGDKQCALRSKDIKREPPEWVVRLLNIAKRYIEYVDNEELITVQVSVRDIGNDKIEVLCFVKPNILAETMFEGTSDEFSSKKGIASWLVSYVESKLTFYDWLNIACLDLLLLVNPRTYKYNDEKGKIKYIRGITKEFGVFGGCNGNFCKDGEYSIVEIVCLGE